ncbi:MAG: TonB-dependent receptor domain-containing protein, partial [Oceanicaulis sp.]
MAVELEIGRRPVAAHQRIVHVAAIAVHQGEDLVPYSEVQVSEVGVYVQDEWQATPKLTVTAGLRHDRQDFRDDPERVVDVERAFDYATGTAPQDNNNISPRLNLAYDVTGDGSSVLRAG